MSGGGDRSIRKENGLWWFEANKNSENKKIHSMLGWIKAGENHKNNKIIELMNKSFMAHQIKMEEIRSRMLYDIPFSSRLINKNRR